MSNKNYNIDKISSKTAFEYFLKKYLEDENQEYHFYYKKTIDKFFALKKILNHLSKGIQFGLLFELYISWLMCGQNSNGFGSVVESEKSGKNPNDGVDIIFPFISKTKKELWITQVKTGGKRYTSISNNVIKLEQRANEIISEAQNSDIDSKTFANKWKIKNRVSKIINDPSNKDEWTLKIFWVTELKQAKRKELKNTNVKSIDIITILRMRSTIKHPNLSDAILTEKFKISSDITKASGRNSIFIGEKHDGDLLIVPLPSNQLINFLEKINDSDSNVDAIFKSNVRYSKGNNEISKRIKLTIEEQPDNFLTMNNGITMLADKISINKNGDALDFEVEGMDIINGQQTVRTVWKNKDLESIKNGKTLILLKVIKKKGDKLGRNIAASSNSQNPISASEILSTFGFNYQMHQELLENGILYSYKTGFSEYDKQFSSLPKIYLKDVLKYWIIQTTANVWTKNQLNSLIEIIAYKKISKSKFAMDVAESFASKNNDELCSEFIKVAKLVVEMSFFKKQIELGSSFDMFSYFAMKNMEKAQRFIDEFNLSVAHFIENFKEIPGDNAANLFKSKKHTGDFFETMKKKFQNF